MKPEELTRHALPRLLLCSRPALRLPEPTRSGLPTSLLAQNLLNGSAFSPPCNCPGSAHSGFSINIHFAMSWVELI